MKLRDSEMVSVNCAPGTRSARGALSQVSSASSSHRGSAGFDQSDQPAAAITEIPARKTAATKAHRLVIAQLLRSEDRS